MHLLVSMFALVAFGPDSAGSTVTYRFTTTMDRTQGAFAEPAGSQESPPPPRIDTQTISVTNVDSTHDRLTVVDPTNAKPDTIVVDRSADGTLHAKLRRGNHWALPIALYDRMTAIARTGAGLQSGASVAAKLQPIASTDAIDGKLSATAAKDATRIAFDGSGDVTPSRELLSGPPPGDGPNGPDSGGNGGLGGFGGRGGFGGGRGGGGRGRGGFGGGTARKAGATVDGVAVFEDGTLARVDSTETLEIGAEGATAKQTWSIERIP